MPNPTGEYWVIHKHSFLMLIGGFFASGIVCGMTLGILMIVNLQ